MYYIVVHDVQISKGENRMACIRACGSICGKGDASPRRVRVEGRVVAKQPLWGTTVSCERLRRRDSSRSQEDKDNNKKKKRKEKRKNRGSP